ncbi:MAG: hypothetical protein QG635_2376 [Bacteroidota bacterium]|nr:hypothetical protein [Bacteroidota bacterium]
MITRIFLLAAILLSSITVTLSNGILIVDASKGNYFTLISSDYTVRVENQAAIIVATNLFVNTDSVIRSPKFAFPMPQEASSIRLRWYRQGIWKDAVIKSTPQDSTLPGVTDTTGIDPNLSSYLGKTPLFFNMEEPIAKGDSITVELSYVQLLKYELYQVRFKAPNNYNLIQNLPPELQTFHLTIKSGRIIEEIQCNSHPDAQIEFDQHQSKVLCRYENLPADKDYEVVYRLKSDDFGLFGFSTYSNIAPDMKDRGFFLFIVEPDASDNTQTLDKLITLVIDRSGSMSGEKIEQAKDAAKFIMERINLTDKFNIVSFDNTIETFCSYLLDFNLNNKTDALKFIDNLTARGSTDIDNALLTAIKQYDGYDDSKDKIIIFLTDGMPTSGVTNTDKILENIRTANANSNVKLHCFGIGEGFNKQFLSLLADQNNGVCDFIDNNQLADALSNFYLKVKNPVLLHPAITFSPDIASEVYPKKLQSLYKGQQLLVSGRYNTPVDKLNITLIGKSDNTEKSFDYNMDLADLEIVENGFLPKIWAKMKIEQLVIDYYSNLNDTSKSNAIKKEIIDLSMTFEVISIFTSYSNYNTNNNTGGKGSLDSGYTHSYVTFDVSLNKNESQGRLFGCPNPFSSRVVFKFYNPDKYYGLVPFKIFDLQGNLVGVIYLNINGPGNYEAIWDGIGSDGSLVMSGSYICFAEFNNRLIIFEAQKLN